MSAKEKLIQAIKEGKGKEFVDKHIADRVLYMASSRPFWLERSLKEIYIEKKKSNCNFIYDLNIEVL